MQHGIKILICILSGIFSSAILFSQDDAKPLAVKTFFAEAGGPGIMFSLNYESRLFKNSVFGWGYRAGIGFLSANEEKINSQNNYFYYEPATAITIPLQVNYIFGNNDSPNSFEIGTGITYIGKRMKILNLYDTRHARFVGAFSFMYRLQPLHGGFTWRMGFTPLLVKGYIQPLGGIGVGYNF